MHAYAQPHSGTSDRRPLRAPAVLQAKLTVNTPGDAYEQEADRVSEQVMRMAEPGAGHACACGGGCPRCRAARAAGGTPRVSRAAEGGAGVGTAPAVVHQVLRSPGQPLDAPARAWMEPRFGRDFGAVRVHADASAAASARAVDAHAYAVGSHVVFGAGRYQPGSAAGRRLLAHELAHVAQQDAAPHRAPVLRRQPGPTAPTAPPAPSKPAITFRPGTNHGHAPSGKWAAVQAAPNSSLPSVAFACKHLSPASVMAAARTTQFSGKPIALAHLDWFLSAGKGADFVEDAHLKSMLTTDTGVQTLIRGALPATLPTSGKHTGSVKVEQSDYVDQDFRFAFGAIDILDFEADFTASTFHAWFMDRYEWHPFYPTIWTPMKDDVLRPTNCVHAAAVELKAGTASDFWMKGEATVPLSHISTAPSPPGTAPSGGGAPSTTAAPAGSTTSGATTTPSGDSKL